MYIYSDFASAVAHYWHKHLSHGVSRPVELEGALLNGITALQANGPQTVVFCSRPEKFRTPGYTGVNLLAVVARELGLGLAEFQPALITLFPALPATLQVHPDGQVIHLMEAMDKSGVLTPRARPTGQIQFDPTRQVYVIPLSPGHPNLSDYEITFTPAH